MGSICCTRQRNDQNLETATPVTKKHKTANPLELYLNDVYEKECELKASQEEVEFIQTGIETLVQEIVDEVLDLFSTHEETDKIFDNEKHKTEIKKYFENDLTDVYFPIKEGSRFQDLTDIKPSRSSIIKVGSFYEGTKNNFPDEFDFIFPLFCGRDILYYFSWFAIPPVVYYCIKSVIIRKIFHYVSPNGTREIYLDSDKGIERHGPAIKLEFIYKNGSTKERHIAVDLVPVYKIVVVNKPDWYVEDVNRRVKPKSFHDKIMSLESCLFVSYSISFTETEVAFIRNVLSKRHRKVYMILKFLINGHGDDETMKNWRDGLRETSIQAAEAYSSYQIKTMMIYHHDECRNSDTADIGPCVLQVLGEMCKYKRKGEFPAFSVSGLIFGYCLVDDLQSVIDRLNSMQTRTDSYSYEEYKIESVSMHFFECRNV